MASARFSEISSPYAMVRLYTGSWLARCDPAHTVIARLFCAFAKRRNPGVGR